MTKILKTDKHIALQIHKIPTEPKSGLYVSPPCEYKQNPICFFT